MAEARGLRRRFVTRVDVEDAARAGVGITVGPTDVLTDEARSRGIFGAPSFVVGDELFWGDDRLGDAIAWFREGRLRGSADQEDRP